MNKTRKWVFATLLTTLTLLGGTALLNYVVDPLQHYRSAKLYRPVYKDSRYLNPGLAKHFSYDTVIVGTSMVQNFRPSTIDELWGGKTVKLPVAGSSAYEQNLVLGVALQSGKARRVLFGLDVFSFQGPADRLSRGAGSLPFYLYDDDPLNDIKYLLSIDTLLFYKYLVRSNYLGKDTEYLEHDNYGYWGNKWRFSREIVLENWVKASFNREARVEDFSFAKLKENFDQNLLRHLRDHPHVQFDIFFPPYSILVWIDSQEKGLNEALLGFKEYVVATTAQMKNVRVFDFQSETEIILDLDRYKDMSHYHPEINSLIIEAIANERYLTSPERNRMNEQELRELVTSKAQLYPR